MTDREAGVILRVTHEPTAYIHINIYMRVNPKFLQTPENCEKKLQRSAITAELKVDININNSTNFRMYYFRNTTENEILVCTYFKLQHTYTAPYTHTYVLLNFYTIPGILISTNLHVFILLLIVE